jgi:hypothetical protein
MPPKHSPLCRSDWCRRVLIVENTNSGSVRLPTRQKEISDLRACNKTYFLLALESGAEVEAQV